MESRRLPRFERVPSVAPLQLTERDRQIVRFIHRHRFLGSHQIVALIGDGKQQILRRLQLLYHHGYLERPRIQIEYFNRGGSRSMVYGLGNKGGTLLKQELGSSFRLVSWGEKNRAVGRIYLEHALLVSDVMVAIELACRKTGRIRLFTGQEILTKHIQEQSFRWKVNINSNLKLGVIPDRVLAIEMDGQPDSRTFFFLEADRGTMPVKRQSLSQTSFFRKLLAYEATWSQGIHRSRFGFHRFRVLTITGSASRVNSLLDACAELKSGHGLFLFADKSILENPDILFSPVWRSGREGQPGSLINQSDFMPETANLDV